MTFDPCFVALTSGCNWSPHCCNCPWNWLLWYSLSNWKHRVVLYKSITGTRSATAPYTVTQLSTSYFQKRKLRNRATHYKTCFSEMNLCMSIRNSDWSSPISRARICKRLRSPVLQGIDFLAYVAWRAGNPVCRAVPSGYICWRNRFPVIDSWAL